MYDGLRSQENTFYITNIYDDLKYFYIGRIVFFPAGNFIL